MIINNKEILYLEIALFVNQKVYESNNIPYNLFKNIEDIIIKKIKCAKNDNN